MPQKRDRERRINVDFIRRKWGKINPDTKQMWRAKDFAAHEKASIRTIRRAIKDLRLKPMKEMQAKRVKINVFKRAFNESEREFRETRDVYEIVSKVGANVSAIIEINRAKIEQSKTWAETKEPQKLMLEGEEKLLTIAGLYSKLKAELYEIAYLQFMRDGIMKILAESEPEKAKKLEQSLSEFGVRAENYYRLRILPPTENATA